MPGDFVALNDEVDKSDRLLSRMEKHRGGRPSENPSSDTRRLSDLSHDTFKPAGELPARLPPEWLNHSLTAPQGPGAALTAQSCPCRVSGGARRSEITLRGRSVTLFVTPRAMVAGGRQLSY